MKILLLQKSQLFICMLTLLLMSSINVFACDCDAPPSNISISTTSTQVTFQASKSYSSSCGCYELQVEMKPVGQAFDGVTNIYKSNAGCINGAGAQALNPVTASLVDIALQVGSGEIKWRIRTTISTQSCPLWAESQQTFFSCTVPPSGSITASGPTQFCEGGSVVLNAPSGSYYKWIKNGTLIAGANSPSYTATTTGNYRVITETNGCPTPVVSVTVNPAPIVTVSAPSTTINYGSSATLTANVLKTKEYFVPLADLLNVQWDCGFGSRYSNSSQGFRWTDAGSGGVSNVKIEFNVGVECNGSGKSYTTSLNGASGPTYAQTSYWCSCSSPSSEKIVTLNFNNPSNYIVSGVNTFAITNSNTSMGFFPAASLNNSYARVTVTYESGASFKWTPGDLTTSSITVSPTNTTTYTLVVTDALGCSTTIPTTINVNPPPISFTLANTNVKCQGGNDGKITVNVTAGSGGSIEYSLDGGAFVTNNVFTGLSAGSYEIRVKEGSYITSPQAIAVGTEIDNQDPTITAPAALTLKTDAGQCTATMALTYPQATDNCAAPTVTHNLTETNGKVTLPKGETTIIWTATDASDNTTTVEQNVTVTDEEKPIIAQIGNITQGIDADKCGAVVEWPSPMIKDNCEDARLTGTHTSGATFPLGTTKVTYTAKDIAGNITEMSFDVTVTDDDAPVLSAAPANITVYTGPDATSCTATASWTALTATDNCSVTVTSSHEPGAAFNKGTTTVKYTAVDAAGNQSEKTFTVIVIDNTNPTITAPAAITRNTEAGSCGAMIGNLGTPVFSDNCSGASVSNNAPAVFPKGVTTVTWTVKDAAGNQATATQIVTVEDNEDPRISAQADITKTNDAGICGAAVTFPLFTASDNCSGVTVAKTDNTGLQSGSVFPVGTTYLEYTATDAAGNTDIRSFSVTVTNAEPTLSAITAPIAPVQINTVVNASASIANGDNNVTKATWYWDSNNLNTKSAGTISGSAITGSYKYTATGVYTVKLVIEDACGKTATNEYEYVVIYDPTGGFVTGGFWINSPAGAYIANPSAIGKANGGFVSKYQKGATVPTGNTQFQFNAVGLEFNSTYYEWLIVSGAKAQYKGVGTINGIGNYGFLLSAVDGQVTGGGGIDKIRIKIWDKNNGDAIVYDNQMGAADDAVASTAIGGGSIVVHDAKTRARMDNTIQTEPSVEVSVYPNPVLDKVTIDLKGMSAIGAKTVLTDAIGKSVLQNAHKVVGESLLELDMSGLRSGLYIIGLRTETAYKVIKVIKQ